MRYTAILKLKQMLDEAKIPYQSFDDNFFGTGKPAYHLQLNADIDVIQFYGSYGHEKDLLEIYGALTVEEREWNSVLGYLTAEEVFKRFKYCYEHNTKFYVEEGGE